MTLPAFSLLVLKVRVPSFQALSEVASADCHWQKFSPRLSWGSEGGLYKLRYQAYLSASPGQLCDQGHASLLL